MPALKDYIKIQYPRKCNHCDYISNNPQMWHYHNKTHDPIPDGQLCDQGCGQPALFRNTGGKYSCCSTTYQCETYIKKHSDKVKQQWSRPEAVYRKEQTKKSLVERLHNPETVNKGKDTKRKKSGILTPEDAKNFRHYARSIRQRAQMWATDNGYKLGHQTYHVDHKLSILDAWKLNLPAEIVNHPANLQVMEAKRNSSKGSKSSITIEQLYEMIKAFV
jgi:hypothetical protein